MVKKDTPLHQVLFRLAARAPALDRAAVMQRLCTAIANNLGAVACSIHGDVSGWPVVTAAPVREIEQMDPLDRARRETIEARLVKETFARDGMISALDLEGRQEVEAFFQRTLGIIDIFAFPLREGGETRGVLVVYLSLDSDPLSDGDVHGLLACGELVGMAGTGYPDDPTPASEPGEGGASRP